MIFQLFGNTLCLYFVFALLTDREKFHLISTRRKNAILYNKKLLSFLDSKRLHFTSQTNLMPFIQHFRYQQYWSWNRSNRWLQKCRVLIKQSDLSAIKAENRAEIWNIVVSLIHSNIDVSYRCYIIHKLRTGLNIYNNSKLHCIFLRNISLFFQLLHTMYTFFALLRNVHET
jgi:hypothetical protein